MIHHRQAAGFSAIELLITLFIAAAFLLTGYQLYLAIIRDSGEVQQRTRASAIATSYLQQYSALVPETCPAAPSNALSKVLSPRPEGLTQAIIAISYSCPSNSPSPGLTKVKVELQYGLTPEESVTHVSYAKRL